MVRSSCHIIKVLISALLLSLCCNYTFAQVDTEFWFVAPEITKDHSDNGLHVDLRIATLEKASTVTISMPRNSENFPDIVVSIPANSDRSVSLDEWVNVGGTEQNQLENKPMNESGINPFGLHITATEPITVYYEVSPVNNRDIWALKGKNALGTEFYVPFQTHKDNVSNYSNSINKDPAYSAIDVVATDNNTVVTFKLPPGVAATYGTEILGKAYATSSTPKIAAGGTYSVKLMAGQTFSLMPRYKTSTAFTYNSQKHYVVSPYVADRLAGTRITSTRPIAVSIKDDSFNHTDGGCYDVAGDQLIPTDVAGWDYIVNRTFLNNKDHIYVLAFNDNTEVYIGSNPTPIATINSQQQKYIALTQDYYRVHTQDADHPIILLHVGGFGCEQGAAIVPPINLCTGSTQVAFTRTSTSNFYLTMMVRDGAQDSFLFDGVKRNDIIKPASFVLVPGTKWRVARFGSFNTSKISQASHLITNTKDLFHLGIVNGNGSTGCEYGYFSSFNEVKVNSTIGGVTEQEYEICLGDTAHLYAFGGNNCLWYRVQSNATNEYLTPDFLDDNTILTPISVPISSGRYTYRVVVEGFCEVKDSSHVSVTVGNLDVVNFGAEDDQICASEGEFVFQDSSDAEIASIFWYVKEDDGNPSNLGSIVGEAYLGPDNKVEREFRYPFINDTDTVKTFVVTNEVWDPSWCCYKTRSKTVKACSIDANPTREYINSNPNGCHPLTVKFTANSTGYTVGATYSWDFDGDGSIDSNEENPTFTYSNFSGAVQTFAPQLTVTTMGGECSAIKTATDVVVQPYLQANFAIDVNQGCSPFTQEVVNNSIGGVATYAWDKDGDGDYDDGPLPITPGSWTFSGTTTNVPKTVSLGLRVATENGKCIDTYQQSITINPTPTTNAVITNLSDADCSPLRLKLEGKVTGPANYYRWEEKVGSGSWTTIAETENIDEYVVENYGSSALLHSFRFTVGNNDGCSTTKDVANIPVQPFIDAQFVIDTVACAPQELAVVIQTIPGIHSYSWNWGDGTSPNNYVGITPPTSILHTYQNKSNTTKTVNVNLLVKNVAGCTVEKSRAIDLFPEVTPDFTISPQNGCAPLDVQFTNGVKYADNTPIAGNATYTWNFGDGTSSYEISPEHTFNNITSTDIDYTVSLTSQSPQGCIDMVEKTVKVRPYVDAIFSVDTSEGCSPLKVNFTYSRIPGVTLYKFTWDDGEEQSISSVAATGTISHTFINRTNAVIVRNVTLSVNSQHCTDNMVIPITVYPEVVSDFSATSLSGCAPHEITFTNLSHFADGSSTSIANSNYHWSFGDGGSSIETSPTHTFNNIGTVDSVYTVALQVNSGFGCSSNSTQQVTIRPYVQAHFAIDTSLGCSPLTVGFSYTTHPSITRYRWTWGDGSTEENTTVATVVGSRFISHQFVNTTGAERIFTVKLEISTANGCTDFMELPITVYPQITARFQPIDALDCSPATIQYSNTSFFTGTTTALTGATYHWDFGDGSSSNLAEPIHTFENNGTTDIQFNVTMTATSEFGCTASQTTNVSVRPFIKAQFAIDTSMGCSPLEITFDYQTHPSIISYRWLWGDGTTSTGTSSGSIKKKYINRTNAVQVRNAMLIIENGTCVDTMEMPITVYPEVAAKIAPRDTIGCGPLEVSFVNKSFFSGTNQALTNGSYSWDFGDGSSSIETSPVHTFNNTGVANTEFKVKLFTQSEYGCKSSDSTMVTVYPFINAQFAVDSSSGCSPLDITFSYNMHPSVATYSWQWGDGVTETVTAPSGSIKHKYVNQTGAVQIYVAKLTIDNGHGCTDFMELPITVYPEILANFQMADTAACNPFTVVFENTSIFNINNTALTATDAQYLWTFGDGSNSTQFNPTHTFVNSSGTDKVFDVNLEVVSNFGCSSNKTIAVTVFPAIEAQFAIDTSSGCSPLTIGFNYTVHPGIARYIFDWNGNSSEVDTITSATGKIFHTYHNTTGAVLNLNPKLSVENVNGCVNSMSMPISVYPEITANFEMSDSSDCASFTVSFNNTSIYSVNGTELTATDAQYLWTFGDGASSTEFEPTHTFSNTSGTARTYQVELSVISANTCTSSITIPVIVHPFIEAQFAIDTSSGCSPLTIGFTYTVHPGITRYIFDWNGNSSEVDTITSATGKIFHTYHNTTGATLNLTPKLTVENVNGCSRSMSIPISVYPEITANFDMPEPSGCAPFEVEFNNTTIYSVNGTELAATDAQYLWTFGDGASSTEFEPTHTFQNNTGTAQVYSVQLAIISNNGCQSVVTNSITVHPHVEAKFSIDTAFGCSPLSIQFNYEIHQGNANYIFDWNGDGSEVDTLIGINGNVLHTYQNQTGAVTNPRPTLTVNNVNGCSKSMTIPVSVYPEVTAAFTTSVDSGCNELAVDIINTSVFTGTANSLTNTRYYWNYGDGGSSEIVSPSHIYINDDTEHDVVYATRLFAVSEYGCTDSVIHNIKVYNRVESHFTFEYASHCTPFEVTLTSAALGASTYVWNYGGAVNLPNDTLYNDDSFVRQFTNLHPSDIAYYNVSLDVTNDEGCHSVEARTVEVYPIVDAQILPSAIAGCSNLEVTFDNASTGGSLVSMWNFGNGQSASNSDGTSVSHIFTNRGSVDSVYTVGLNVINPNGCRDSVTTQITVYPKVESSFVFAQQSQCTPFYLDLTNTSLNGNTFEWDFGYAGLDTVVYSKQSFPYIFDNFTDNDILTYTITMTASDNRTGCSDVSSLPITVYPRVVTRFDADVIEGCNPLSVNFSNTSTGLGTYLWEFGDGSTSNVHTPDEHLFVHGYKDKSVDFPVKLTTTNAFGCKSFKDTVITVYPLVESAFQWDKFEGCTPLTVKLNNSSVSGQYQYNWDFGDGSDTTIAQPVEHTYINTTNAPPSIQTRTISLAVSYEKNGLVCSDTMRKDIVIYPHIYPDFTAIFAGCNPHSETFHNATVAYSNNNNYRWNLGNGLFSIEQEPSLVYYNTSKVVDSIYVVQLISTSEHGCVDSISHNVTVHPLPFAAMEVVGDYISCPEFDVELDNNSIGTNLTNIFNFGDGTDSITTSMSNITHNYTNSESETVPYIIQLNIETEFGCKDSVIQTVYVYPEVTAQYSVNPGHAGCSPFSVQFNSEQSNNAKFYLWNFDDGITSSYTTPTHLFINSEENDKVFDVTMYASSEFGCFDIDTQQIISYATPIVNFAVEPPMKQYPDATFNIYNQSSPAADSWNYSWNFGDFQFSSLKNPGTHTYLNWGPKENDYKYNVSLKIESPHCMDSLSSSVYLLPAEPIAEFYSEIDSSCSPLEVNLINVSEYGETYFWDFGDGTTSTEMEPSHTFIDPGYYNVKLTVSGDGGKRFYYRTFRVYQNPTASFVVSPSRVMLPDATIRAFNLSKDYTRCLWDLGDGTISTDQDPVHTYSKLGEYNISLWVYSDYGNDVCADSVSRNPAAWVDGEGIIKFPNAFKPNQDGPNGGVYDVVDYKNQVFHPFHYGVTDYKLIILNRWGEQLFTSEDVNIGWDGYVNGKLADQAVYVWRAVGKFTNEQPFDIKGTVTLIR